MEKVLLTKEQAHEFESFKALRNSLEDWARDKHDSNAVNSIIHELTFDQMARAFLIGYEIEPEKPKFQPGNKVTYLEKMGPFEEVVLTIAHRHPEQDRGEKKAWKYEDGDWDYEHVLRLATSEEIYWLETLKRKTIGDFHYGDVAVGLDEHLYLVGMGEISINDAKDMYNHGLFKGIYPIDSYSRLPKEETK